MKTVLTLVCLLSVAHYAASACTLLKNFNTTFLPACSPNDVYIKWPNYENQESFYRCYGSGNPVVTPCPAGEYFIFVQQTCGDCLDYIPPVQCSQLRTQYPPTCTAIGSNATTAGTPTGPTLPTPIYPNSTTPGNSSVTPTVTPTPTPVTPPTAVTPPTPPTPPGATDFPGPETPATPAPNVPTPPTPAATPPNVEVTPPTAAP